jgi:hypothetical protein
MSFAIFIVTVNGGTCSMQGENENLVGKDLYRAKHNKEFHILFDNMHEISFSD